MKPLKIIIIEDHLMIRKHTVEMVTNNGDIVVGQAGSVRQGVDLLTKKNFDLLLLDINLQGGSGFDILKEISPFNIPVIFLTAYHEFAIQAIKNGAIDYILKPINKEELHRAIEKARDKLNCALPSLDPPRKLGKIAIKHLSTIQLLPFEEIVYCQGDSGYTTFFMKDGRKILASKYMKLIESALPQNIFLRTHQSYIINRNFIEEYNREGFLVMRNGAIVPVSTRSRVKIIENLSNY